MEALTWVGLGLIALGVLSVFTSIPTKRPKLVQAGSLLIALNLSAFAWNRRIQRREAAQQ